MSVKCINEDFDSTVGIMTTVNCLAQLPDPRLETVTICKIFGETNTKVWDVLQLKHSDIAKATR